MRVYRLTSAKYAATALLGHGARRVGGRWHSSGTALAYTTETPELALLEAMGHTDIDLLPATHVLLEFEIPDKCVAKPHRIPSGWDAPLPYLASIQRLGDAWVSADTSLALSVPSAIMPQRRTILINPVHADFPLIETIKNFKWTWPPRLIEIMASMKSKQD